MIDEFREIFEYSSSFDNVDWGLILIFEGEIVGSVMY